MTSLRDALQFRSKRLYSTFGLDLPSLTVGGSSVAGPDTLQPEDRGLVSQSYDPRFAGTSQTITNGTIYLNKLRIRSVRSVTKVWWLPNAAGTTPVTAQNWAGIVNAAGQLISSVDITANNGAQTPQSATLGTPLTNLAVGTYWVALLFNDATPRSLYRTSGGSQGNNMVGESAATYSHAINGTGATVLPSSFTLGSNSLGPSIWVGIS